MIEIKNVSHTFGERCVLNNLNVVLNEHKIAVVGSNGSGKSTFLRLLNGLLVPDTGEVNVDGLSTQKDGKKVRKKVGFVFQNPDNQIVFPTVEEDIAFGMKNLGMSAEVIEQRTHEVLERHSLLAFKDHSSYLLSGGQKQLLAISGVLVMDPEYIVFDEPTTLLDLKNTRIISDVMQSLEQHIIVASHNLELLESFDRVLVFDGGKIVCDDIPARAITYYKDMMQ